MASHSSILAWRIHRQSSLVGYSPWGHRESDTTEANEHASWTLKREEYCSSLVNWTEFSSNARGPVSLCKLPGSQHHSPPSMVFDNRKSGNPREGHKINLEP